MKQVVLVEAKNAADEWVCIGRQPPGTSGSVSSTAPSRQIYIFGWVEDDGPAVWRSMAGVDIENDAYRVVHSTRLVRIADLKEGPYVLAVMRSDGPMQLRLRMGSPG